MKRLLTIAVFALLGMSCTDHVIPPQTGEEQTPTDTLPVQPEGPKPPLVCPPSEAERVAYFSAMIEKITGKEVVLTAVENGWYRGVFTAMSDEYKQRGFDCDEYARLHAQQDKFTKTNTESIGLTWDAYFTVPVEGYVKPIAHGYKIFVPPYGQKFVEVWFYREQRDKDGNLLSKDTVPLFKITFSTK